MVTALKSPQSKPYVEKLSFEELSNKLAKHIWSFQTDSYYSYMLAVEIEAEMFRQAELLGLSGIDHFRYRQLSAIKDHGLPEVTRITDYYKNQVQEVRERYMRPEDHYEEKLQRHDWFYSYSDDHSVWRAGEQREAELKKEGLEGSPQMQVLWWKYVQKRSDALTKA